MPLEKGQRLGGYEILGKLGAGGMGAVYRARDPRLDREVAIKVLPRAVGDRASLRARFEREAKAVAALSHPSIVAIHDYGSEDGRMFAVTELVDGESLRERLAREPFGVRKTLELGAQIARGLAAAHDKGIVHRDLKPENLMITRSGRAKILDFGLAARLDELEAAAESVPAQTPTRTSLTDPGTVLGTVGYMSPEQVRGEPADERSDIFSFGAVLYEMMTGSRAFARETAAESMTAILREEPEALVELPPVVAGLVGRCLEKNPGERFHSAADVAFSLEAALAGSNAEASLAGKPAFLRRFWWSAAIGATALAVAAVVILGRPSVSSAPSEAVGSVHLRQLTFEDELHASPAVSPDGKTIAYVLDHGERDIYSQRVGGERRVNLTPGIDGGAGQPEFSPAGDHIAFSATYGGIFVMGATGESRRRLTSEGFHPAWSPDGTELVICDVRVDHPYGRVELSGLWRVDVETGAKRPIDTGGQDAVQPHWSPNGRHIAFWGLLAQTGERVLFTVPAAGGVPRPLTEDKYVNWNPVWSADGSGLYFASDRGGQLNLWRLPMDPERGIATGPPTPVAISPTSVGMFDLSREDDVVFTSDHATYGVERFRFDPRSLSVENPSEEILSGRRSVHGPEPSPDDRWVAYYGTADYEDLYVVATDGTGIVRLTSDPPRDRGPNWSADGRRIYFHSDRNGTYDVWSIAVDGSGISQVTDVPEVVFNPVLSPDGTRLSAMSFGEFRVYDLEGGWPVSRYEVPDFGRKLFPRGTIHWSPDQRFLAGLEDPVPGDVLIHAPGDGSTRKIEIDAFEVSWLPEGHRLLCGTPDGPRVVELDTGEIRAIEGLPPRAEIVRATRRYLYSSLARTESDLWMLSF